MFSASAWSACSNRLAVTTFAHLCKREKPCPLRTFRRSGGELEVSCSSKNFGIDLADLIPDEIADIISTEEDLAEALDKAVTDARERTLLNSRGFKVERLRQPQPTDLQDSGPTTFLSLSLVCRFVAIYISGSL